MAGPARVQRDEPEIVHVEAEPFGSQLERSTRRGEHVHLVAAVPEEPGQLQRVSLPSSERREVALVDGDFHCGTFTPAHSDHTCSGERTASRIVLRR